MTDEINQEKVLYAGWLEKEELVFIRKSEGYLSLNSECKQIE